MFLSWRAVLLSLSSLAVVRVVGALRIEDSDARIVYLPPPVPHTECEHTTIDASCRVFWWTEGTANNSLHYTLGGPATSLSLPFNGSAISLFGWRSKLSGAAYVAIDDTPGVFVDFAARGMDDISALAFHSGALDSAIAHVLRLEYASERGDEVIGIDYFEIEEVLSDAIINVEDKPNEVIDPSPSFPAFVTAVPLAIGIIMLTIALLSVGYCWLSRRRMRVRTGEAEARPSMSIDVPLRAVRVYDSPHWQRKYFAPPDAPTRRSSSPGTPVDERAEYPTLSQIAGEIPNTPGTEGRFNANDRPRVSLRVHNPDTHMGSSVVSTEEGPQRPWGRGS
ncbi:hypothetical protein AURDEDRAFT_173027 [Auricularia subglabra TFB-10046 SS5]|uniref:Uncharacterized protein n=1 Tax=Auricularia subglabra (strain TFB-10046 / SS5) TaxID=717982 RepID=J0DBA2_AURST|nr:hypothetical protein AURDEDRAFT_173027 [Auricularia subglabra TFB-10046 SS5]